MADELVILEKETNPVGKEIERFFDGRKSIGKRSKNLPPAIARIYKSLSLFFRTKSWYTGGPIPEGVIYNKDNFHLINNIDLVNAIDIGYASIAIEQSKDLAKANKFLESATLLQSAAKINSKSEVLLRAISFLEERSISKFAPEKITEKSKNYDIKLCVKIINHCASLKIPQSHVAGLYLLYLQICKGITLLD